MNALALWLLLRTGTTNSPITTKGECQLPEWMFSSMTADGAEWVHAVARSLTPLAAYGSPINKMLSMQPDGFRWPGRGTAFACQCGESHSRGRCRSSARACGPCG